MKRLLIISLLVIAAGTLSAQDSIPASAVKVQKTINNKNTSSAFAFSQILFQVWSNTKSSSSMTILI